MTASTVSFTMHGIGVSGGIAIGQAHLFAGMSAEALWRTLSASSFSSSRTSRTARS